MKLAEFGQALWWLRNTREAVVYREREYAGFRRDGELARAARIALWLSREYALVFGNDAVASGWLARAERLLRDVAPGAEQGWLSLARSERTRGANESARLAEEALAVAEAAGDTDLELRALAQLGLAEVSVGQVDDGLARLDEAGYRVVRGLRRARGLEVALCVPVLEGRKPLEPRCEVPVPGAEQLHGRRQEHCADDRGVDQDRDREPDAELLEERHRERREDREDGDHDERGARDLLSLFERQ